MGRQLAITKRTTLGDIEGWDDCYVDCRPATYGDQLEVRAMRATGNEDEIVKSMIVFVKRRVVSGKVRVNATSGEPELVNIEPDDIDALPTEAVDRIFANIMGIDYSDPKAEAPVTEPTTTETPSSEDSASPATTPKK